MNSKIIKQATFQSLLQFFRSHGFCFFHPLLSRLGPPIILDAFDVEFRHFRICLGKIDQAAGDLRTDGTEDAFHALDHSGAPVRRRVLPIESEIDTRPDYESVRFMTASCIWGRTVKKNSRELTKE